MISKLEAFSFHLGYSTVTVISMKQCRASIRQSKYLSTTKHLRIVHPSWLHNLPRETEKGYMLTTCDNVNPCAVGWVGPCELLHSLAQ